MNIKTKKLISKKSKNKNKKSKSKKKEIKIELKGGADAGADADKVIKLQKTTDFSSFKYEMIAALSDMEVDIVSGIRTNPFTYYIPEDGSKLINVLKAKPLGAGSFGAVYKTEMILGIGGQKGDYIIKTDFGEKNSILQDAQNLLMREARMINIISNGVDDKKKKKC